MLTRALGQTANRLRCHFRGIKFGRTDGGGEQRYEPCAIGGEGNRRLTLHSWETFPQLRGGGGRGGGGGLCLPVLVDAPLEDLRGGDDSLEAARVRSRGGGRHGVV